MVEHVVVVVLPSTGTYNNKLSADGVCLSCPNGTTTINVGSDTPADCQLCDGGFGGPGCSQLCGGVGNQASYGPPGRALNSPCVPCSAAGETRGFSYDWALSNDVMIPRTVSREGAALSLECLAEYSQLSDGSFFLPLFSSAGVVVTAGVQNFSACVQLCTDADCMLVTYDYRLQECSVRVAEPPLYEG